jgi:hypothetical protein
MPKKICTHPDNGQKIHRPPKIQENAQKFWHCAEILGLPVIPKAMPAYSAWP